MNGNFKLILIFLLMLVNAPGTARAEDDWQYWNRNHFIFYSKDKWTCSLLTDTRLHNDFRRVGLYFISPRVKYAAHKNLDLQLNLTYLMSRSASWEDFGFMYRIEPEINPYFTVGERLKVHFRNRTEFRWIEGMGSYNTQYRGRIRFTFSLKNTGRLKNVFADSEFFYSFAEHDHIEQRTIPAGITLSFSEKVQLELFHMIQHRRGSTDWSSNQVIGSMLTVRF